MKTSLTHLVNYVALTLTCLEPIVGSANDYFFTNLLKSLRNDILNLKPGSNKTYILNSKLLGRNDSIELDIKSRAKKTCAEEIHNEHHQETHEKRSYEKDDKKHERLSLRDTKERKELHMAHHRETHGKKSREEVNKEHGRHSLRDRKEREELRHKIRKAMMKELQEVQETHRLKIRKVMKHKGLNEGKRKIRIKVLRKHKIDDSTEPVTDIMDVKVQAKPKAKQKVRSLRILHVPVLKIKKVHRGRKVVNGISEIEVVGDPEDDSGFEEGGQIPELFLGEDLDQDQVSALFRNTKDLIEYVVTPSTTATTTTTTTTEASTKTMKDEYTYEYVYEDELEKGKGLKKDKNKKEERKGATEDEYTYEYIYEDEMKRGKAITPSITTPKPTETTTTTIALTTQVILEETVETEEQGSNVQEPVKLSPSVEKAVEELQEMERNATQAPVDREEYYGDSNSQYKEPERFVYDSERQPQDDSQYPTDYDWNCPAATTAAQTFRVAASSIMYDDENTAEFLAERNRTKIDRGYDSYPAHMIFTCDVNKIRQRYTRPKLTPEWYDSIDNDIDHWGCEWEDNLQREPTLKPKRNKTSVGRIGYTKPYNSTQRRQRHNTTFNEKMEYNFDVEKILQNSSKLWMKNITQPTTHGKDEESEVFVTIDDLNRFRIPEYMPKRKIKRFKRDIGGGMKMPRRQYEVLMYLAQKKNHTRWIARLKKLKAAPNLMEKLIRKTKKKVNKDGIVYKQKALKPKKRPKGPKRVIMKRRKPKENRRAVRIKLGAQRQRKKQSLKRKRRSVDNMDPVKVHDRPYFIVSKVFNEKINNWRYKRNLEKAEVKLVRKKRKVDKLSDDLFHDFEQNPEKMQGL